MERRVCLVPHQGAHIDEVQVPSVSDVGALIGMFLLSVGPPLVALGLPVEALGPVAVVVEIGDAGDFELSEGRVTPIVGVSPCSRGDA